MAATDEKIDKNIGAGSAATTARLRRSKTNPEAPAGSEESLGAESVRDGRPATDDSVVEAMDEEDPGPVK
jgi:hypothetical protein